MHLHRRPELLLAAFTALTLALHLCGPLLRPAAADGQVGGYKDAAPAASLVAPAPWPAYHDVHEDGGYDASGSRDADGTATTSAGGIPAAPAPVRNRADAGGTCGEENARLKDEVGRLKDNNDRLRQRIARLHETNGELKFEFHRLKDDTETLAAAVAAALETPAGLVCERGRRSNDAKTGGSRGAGGDTVATRKEIAVFGSEKRDPPRGGGANTNSSSEVCGALQQFAAKIADGSRAEVPALQQQQQPHAVVATISAPVARSQGRRLAACATFLEASHASLQNRGAGLADGVNYVSETCTVGAETIVNDGETYKVAKHPSASGVVALDRGGQSSSNHERFFKVNSGGTLEVTGLTLTGGYLVSTAVAAALCGSHVAAAFMNVAFRLHVFTLHTSSYLCADDGL